METVNLHFKDHHAVIELNRPKAHAINHAMVNDIREALASLAESEYVQGAILTGQGNIFSAGLDIVELYGYNQDKMDNFWDDFGEMVRDLVSFPKPLIAAINGHSPAGGCVLAMCCDYRIMADGDYRIGLNEVPVGIVVPRNVADLCIFSVGEHKAQRMFLNGLLMLPQEAEAFGLIEDTGPQAQLLSRAELKLDTWLAMPQTPWRKIKRQIRQPLIDRLSGSVEEMFGDTIRAWWSQESRAAVGAVVERLTKKG